jgi:hypothetical protein
VAFQFALSRASPYPLKAPLFLAPLSVDHHPPPPHVSLAIKFDEQSFLPSRTSNPTTMTVLHKLGQIT